MDYITIKNEASAEYIVKKSRFIGYAMPVKTQQQANDFIAVISKKHRDASHNVYAYILRDNQIKRYSDNGEPQGTAGIPVLDVLQKEGLVDVCVVVTRYFGGTMLGAGGLVRAYSHTASIAVNSAKIAHMKLCCEVSLTCEYHLYGKLSYLFPSFGMKVLQEDFSDEVKISLLILKERFDAFRKEITELSNGQVVPLICGERFENCTR